MTFLKKIPVLLLIKLRPAKDLPCPPGTIMVAKKVESCSYIYIKKQPPKGDCFLLVAEAGLEPTTSGL